MRTGGGWHHPFSDNMTRFGATIRAGADVVWTKMAVWLLLRRWATVEWIAVFVIILPKKRVRYAGKG